MNSMQRFVREAPGLCLFLEQWMNVDVFISVRAV